METNNETCLMNYLKRHVLMRGVDVLWMICRMFSNNVGAMYYRSKFAATSTSDNSYKLKVHIHDTLIQV